MANFAKQIICLNSLAFPSTFVLSLSNYAVDRSLLEYLQHAFNVKCFTLLTRQELHVQQDQSRSWRTAHRRIMRRHHGMQKWLLEFQAVSRSSRHSTWMPQSHAVGETNPGRLLSHEMDMRTRNIVTHSNGLLITNHVVAVFFPFKRSRTFQIKRRARTSDKPV